MASSAGWRAALVDLALRAGRVVLGLVLLATALFALVALAPGDPASAPLGRDPDPRRVAENRAVLHLDDPLVVQWARTLVDPLRGDLGTSLATGQPVSDLLAERLPNTLRLGVASFVVAFVGAVAVGVTVAVGSSRRSGRAADTGYMAASSVLYAVPEFVLAPLLVVVFVVNLGWFRLGSTGAADMVLPVLALALPQGVLLSRVVRAETLHQLDAGYLVAARAKHLGAFRTHVRHLVPNVLTSAITLAGPMLAVLVTGSVLVEQTFAWPGIGKPLVDAVLVKDYPVLRAVVLLSGAVVLAGTFVVDTILVALDPRSTLRR